MEFTVREIAEKLNAQFYGDGDKLLNGVASIENCDSEKVVFAIGQPWLKFLKDIEVGVVIVQEDPGIDGLNYIIHKRPHHAFVEIIHLFHPQERQHKGISADARVAETAVVAAPCSIAHNVTIGDGARIGPGANIYPGVYIGENVVIGEGCTLKANVVIEHDCVLGDNVMIHAGSIIGTDGYGFLRDGDRHLKIPQLGRVVIGNDVEIQANSCVDRGALEDTVVGNGVKMDNCVHIGHNCIIGDNCLIVAQVGISGSCKLGKNVVLAGKVGLKDGVSIGDGTIVTAQSIVTKNLKAGMVAGGYPAANADNWRKYKVIQRNLPKHWPAVMEMLKEWEKSKKNDGNDDS